MRSSTGNIPLDPNYFRLRYLVAAQLLNLQASAENANRVRDREFRARIERALEAVGIGDPPAAGAGSDPKKLIERALHEARELEEEASLVIGHLGTLRRRAEASRLPRLLRRSQPSSADLKLEVFLAGTVQPCAMVLRAGALAYRREWAESDRIVDELSGRDAEELSYRVHYNLLCYRTVRSEADDLQALEAARQSQLAMQSLATTLRLCPVRRRRELLYWLEKDPTLEPLRESEAFKAQLKTYEFAVEEKEASSPPDGDEEEDED